MRRANNQVDKQRQGVGRFREGEKTSKAGAKPELGHSGHCPWKDTASQGPSTTGQAVSPVALLQDPYGAQT